MSHDSRESKEARVSAVMLKNMCQHNSPRPRLDAGTGNQPIQPVIVDNGALLSMLYNPRFAGSLGIG